MSPTGTTTAELLHEGRCTVPLSRPAAAALDDVYTEAQRFFSQTEDVKLAHGSADFNFGYRPYGRQYSVTPERPDENASFTYWAGDPATVPQHRAPTVAGFLRALHIYWDVVTETAETVLADLAGHYGRTEPLPFRTSSYLEINWYLPDSERDLLQDRHEDGHLFTLATSDGPGLELEIDGQMHACNREPGTLLVMPGSVLTAMTDRQIPPLYHQVRNYHLPRRTTVLLLVNPPLDRPVAPYAGDPEGFDAASLARHSGSMFGLPPAPVLDAADRP